MDSAEDTVDGFRLQKIFPNAQQIFSRDYAPVEKIKDECWVTLDTNVLLAPYRFGSQPFESMVALLERLRREERLFITGHVAREYARRRQRELSELVKTLQDRSSRAAGVISLESCFLDSDRTYIELKKEQEEIDKAIKKARKTVDVIVKRLSDPINGDPIFQRYKKILSGIVVDLLDRKDGRNHAEIMNERYDLNIPPGYKDKDKDFNKEGDFLIWMTILQVASERRCSMIFVTGDGKGDWFDRGSGQSFQPRFELIEEYQRYSDGATIHIMPLSSFLRTFDAPKASIEATKKMEMDRSSSISDGGRVQRIFSAEEQAVRKELADLRTQLQSVPKPIEDTDPESVWSYIRTNIMQRERMLQRRLRQIKWQQYQANREKAGNE